MRTVIRMNYRSTKSAEMSALTLQTFYLSPFARHNSNELPVSTNCAINLNLGGTVSHPACGFAAYGVPSYARRSEKGREACRGEGGGRTGRPLIRRRARIPCRCISGAVIMAKRSLVPRKQERDETETERERGRERGARRKRETEYVRGSYVGFINGPC